MLLARDDGAGVAALKRSRLRWLVVPLALYLAVVLVFARDILAFFRPEFVEGGVAPLRLLAVCTALTTLLSMEPTYFKHRRRNRVLFGHVAAAVVVQFVLLWLMIPHLGATGAAIAYTAPPRRCSMRAWPGVRIATSAGPNGYRNGARCHEMEPACRRST